MRAADGMAWRAGGHRGRRPGTTRARAPPRRRTRSMATPSRAIVGVLRAAARPAPVADPVEPPGVGLAGDHLGPGEHVEQERLGGGAALDEDGGLRGGRSAAGPAPPRGRGPRRSPWRSSSRSRGEITSPAATPVSTRMPGPVGRFSIATVPGAGAKPSVGVLGVQPGLDRVAELRRAARPRGARPPRPGSAA